MFFSGTAAPNETTFSMQHFLDKEIQVCSYEVYEITNGHALYKGTYFYIGLYSKNL